MFISSMIQKIDEVQELIFQCRFKDAVENTVAIAEDIEKSKIFSDQKKVEAWKQMMYYLTLGLQNKDYLVVGDILKYELKPVLQIEG